MDLNCHLRGRHRSRRLDGDLGGCLGDRHGHTGDILDGRIVGRRLLLALRRRFLRLHVALESFTLGLAAHAISLGVLDARRVCLDPDTEGDTEIKRLFVGESELFGEQGQTNLCGHGFLIGFAVSDDRAVAPGGSPMQDGRATRESRKTGRTCYRVGDEAQTCSVSTGRRDPKRTCERLSAHRLAETRLQRKQRRTIPAQPGSAARQ